MKSVCLNKSTSETLAPARLGSYMKKNILIVFLFYSFLSIGQQLHEKLYAKIVKYGIQDDGDNCVELLPLNRDVDFSNKMIMNYTGNYVVGGGSDGTTETTWILEDTNNDGFPDRIGFEQEQIGVDGINSGGGNPEYDYLIVKEFKNFDKTFFCDKPLIFDSRCGEIENYYEIIFEPIITIIQPVQNEISCDLTRVNLAQESIGFSSSSYLWQYHTGDNNWTSFPSILQGNSFIDITKSLFGDYRGNVFLRIKSCSKISNIVTYKTIDCSPQLKGFSTMSTECSYSTDGAFELKLSRNLNIGEKLAVTIYTEGTSGNFDQIPNGGQQLAITSLTDNGDGTYSYQWPSVLPADTFKVKYQTYTNGTGDDIDFSSLEHKDGTFTIGSAAPVVFFINKLNDENCFDAKDGKIEITANGENGRTFEYQYYKEGVLQNSTWISFSDNTVLSNLSKARYRVQVRDSKKCYAR